MKSFERKILITYSGDPLFCTVKSREIIKRFSVHFSTFRNFLKIEGQCSRRLGLRFLWPTRRALSYGGKPFFFFEKKNQIVILMSQLKFTKHKKSEPKTKMKSKINQF